MVDYFCKNCNKIFSVREETQGAVSCPSCSADREKGTLEKLLQNNENIGGCRIIKPLYKKEAFFVYLAEQSAIGRQVYLRVLDISTPEGKNALPSFIARARTSVKNPHPHIVSVLNAGKKDHLHYCILPKIQGATLAEILTTRKVYTPEAAISLLRGAAEAMQTMWKKQNAFHGLLNPECIIISDDGDTMVMNFWDTPITGKTLFTGENRENIPYLSPAHASEDAQLTFQSDIYSLGAILFHMTAKCLPFEKSPPEKIREYHLAGRSFLQEYTQNNAKKLPEPFLQLLQKMCAVKEEEKFRSWDEYLAEAEKTVSLLRAGQRMGSFHEAPKIPAVLLRDPPSSTGIPAPKIHEKESNTQGKTLPAAAKKENESSPTAKVWKYIRITIYLCILISGSLAAVDHYREKVHEKKIKNLNDLISQAIAARRQHGMESKQFLALKKTAKDYAKKHLSKDEYAGQILQELDKKIIYFPPAKITRIQQLYRQYSHEQRKLFHLMVHAGIQISPRKTRYKFRNNSKEKMLVLRKEIYEQLAKLEKLLLELEKNPGSNTTVTHFRKNHTAYSEKIRFHFSSYDRQNEDAKEKKEKTLLAAKATPPASPETAPDSKKERKEEEKNVDEEKVVKVSPPKKKILAGSPAAPAVPAVPAVPAAGEESADAEKNAETKNQKRLRLYRQRNNRILQQHLQRFLLIPPTVNRKVSQKWNRSVYPYSLPPALAGSPEAKMIRDEYRKKTQQLNTFEKQASDFYKHLASSDTLYRKFALTIEKKKGSVWRIKNAKLTFRPDKAPEAKILSLPGIGRRNLAQLAIHAAQKVPSLKKNLFPFLLKIFAYKTAEKYAVTELDKAILKDLVSLYPPKTFIPFALFLLQSELRHTPSDLVDPDLQNELNQMKNRHSVRQVKKETKPDHSQYRNLYRSRTSLTRPVPVPATRRIQYHPGTNINRNDPPVQIRNLPPRYIRKTKNLNNDLP